MAFTYTGDPRISTKDAVRFEIQDTNPAAPLLTDEEVMFALTVEGVNTPDESTQSEILEAGAHCMEALARRFAALADRQSGTLKIVSTKRAAQYDERAKDLRLRAQELHAPYAGGISRSEKIAQAQNPNREGSMFRLRQFQGRRGRGWGGCGLGGGC
jgi:hypothetical protein